jgi:spermidine synthase
MDIYIDIREQEGVRSMRFESSCVQGAMRLDRPDELVLEYTRAMMTPLLLRDGDFPQRVLLIGLGAGSMVRFLYRHFPSAHLTTVEIEPAVVEAAKLHFFLPDDQERLHLVVGDGVAFMLETTESYDLILVDGFNQHAHPGELNSLAFYRACRDRLAPNGMLAVNLIGLSDKYKGGLVYVEEAFDGSVLRLPRCRSGNTIAVAVRDGLSSIPSMPELRLRVAKMIQRTALDLGAFINTLEV